MFTTHERFDAAVIQQMQQEIAAAGGQEVLFVGRVDVQQRVVTVEVFARGSESSVAAPAEFCERGDIVLHNHPNGVLRPSDADVAVAAELAERGIGSAIVNNAVSEVYVLVEPVPPEEVVPIDEASLAGHIAAGGAVSAGLPHFRERPSQVEMLRSVVQGFNEDQVVVAEAGTGVGKSFAYLIPAVAWAVKNHERVVIATATINLQQQLIDRDLETVQRALGTSVPTALVKGRGNYICPRRLGEQRDENSLFAGSDDVDALISWAETTPTGSRSDLPFFVPDELWSRVNSEVDSCSVARCPNRETCFILKARRAAAGAQILVANHHLVFSDLAIRRAGAGWEGTAVLPAFQRIIFDEAHNMERAATSFFSQSVSFHGILRQLGRVLRRRGPHRFGLLERVPGLGAAAEDISAVETELDRVRQEADQFNTRLTAFLADEASWRFTPETAAAFRAELSGAFTDMNRALQVLTARMAALARGIDDQYREDPTFLQFVAVSRRLQDIGTLLDRFTGGEHEADAVFWLDGRRDGRGKRWVNVIITPLDLRSLMEEAVFEPYGTVVMTSATLAVNGSFSFWGGRLGVPLETDRVLTGQFASPFDYPRRVTLAVPQDAPMPDAPLYSEYLETLIQRLINASGGGALVLFTSYRQLIAIFDRVAPYLEQRGYSCYRQGNDDRARLMAQFLEDTSGVLFATDSFWEGIDAPGETLRLVIVCRLPFRVPTDPVQRARSEAVEQGGGNSFYEFSLPQAVMRLKQGFGRLMRRSEDYGVVVVTDPRIVYKSYGRIFWNSLPPADPLVAPGETLVEEVTTRLARYQREASER